LVKDIRPLVDNVHNADWLNAVRNISGSEYNDRVPEATQANITEVVQNLWDVPALRNQFIDALINRIGLVIFKNLTWSNPLAKFKRGMLNYGETIEEIMAGLLTAATYDAKRDELEKELFGAMTPEVQVSYHHVDRRDRYKLTVREAELRKAFLNSGGVSEFMTNLMGMLQNSDQWDEFNIMANLFNEMDKVDGFFNVHVEDVSDPASTADDAKGMLRSLRAMGNTLPYISRSYNPAGLPVAAKPDELELFITADADAAVDVEALAAAFNISKAEFGARKTVIPQKHFGIPDVQAILTTRDFFVCADQRIEITGQYNPASLLNNYWLHHWGVYSVSRFAPAILFSTRPNTTITITDTPVTGIEAIVLKDKTGTVVTAVKRGSTYSVENNAITTPVGGSNDAVIYSVVAGAGAANGPFTVSQFTYITNDGVLIVGPDEQNEKLTINTVAQDNDAFTATATVNVTGDLIIPWPNPVVIPDSNNNSLPEVTPEKPGWDGAHTITIPNVVGVQYKNGATSLNNGTTVTVANGTPVTITAVARAGYELASGATATWTFTYNTP
jgi:hypothetical protein